LTSLLFSSDPIWNNPPVIHVHWNQDIKDKDGNSDKDALSSTSGVLHRYTMLSQLVNGYEIRHLEDDKNKKLTELDITHGQYDDVFNCIHIQLQLFVEVAKWVMDQ
jgi:hypothetical protein